MVKEGDTGRGLSKKDFSSTKKIQTTEPVNGHDTQNSFPRLKRTPSQASIATSSTDRSFSTTPEPSQPPAKRPNLEARTKGRLETEQTPEAMSKLSEGLKALINAPFARPGYTKPASNIRSIFQQLSQDAQSRGVGTPAWVTFSTATAMTMNSPEAMRAITTVASSPNDASSPKPGNNLSEVQTAELQREVGLKCISFNGIPRTINVLGAFVNSLPAPTLEALKNRKPGREFSSGNIDQRKTDGLGLWDSVYYGFERKLLSKLADSHPDLPVHIINSHYANLLSNPQSFGAQSQTCPVDPQLVVGRVLTSIVAIACLRAQTGVGPQVVSHVFGLRKAYERGDAEADGEVEVEGGKYLSTEEGNRWLLESIDEIARAIGAGAESELKGGTSFAPGIGRPSDLKAKL